jgi:hypothetical protein
MTTQQSTALEIARSSLLNLESAKRQLEQLESLIFAVIKLNDSPAHASNLLSVAWYLATESAGMAENDYDAISDALADIAPRSAQTENVARDSEVSV